MLRVTSFEWVPGPGATVLVRLAGRWSAAPPKTAPRLLAGDVAVRALPDPSAPSGELRAAFPVPRCVVEDPAADFALQLEDGPAQELARPARGRTPLERALAEIETVRAAATARERAHRDQKKELEAELASARDRIERLEAERDGLKRREMSPDGRIALDRRHAAEVEDLERRLRRSDTTLQRSRREMADELRSLGADAAALEHELQALRADALLAAADVA